MSLLSRIRSWLQGSEPAAAPSPSAPPPRFGLEALKMPHKVFDAQLRWHLTRDGLSLDGKPPVGTPGQPITVKRILSYFGNIIRDAAREYGVPMELIVATIAVEAGVDVRKSRDAAIRSERREPGFTTYNLTPHRVSIGVMHTLLSTARMALKHPKLTDSDLRDPVTSIRAGTAYIASQLRETGFDPPLVAAAYNAGSVRDDPQPNLPFSLVDFPAGEDRHVERFVQFFNDVMKVLREQPEDAEGAPAFVHWL